MSCLAIITARGGSKRIPRKNIKNFCGKPIIAYSIETAMKAGVFDEVMVSTDDNEIADISKGYGATVPFFRSEVTSNDYATTVDVLLEVLADYKAMGKSFDYCCCIYPTAPFITFERLNEAYGMLVDEDIDSVIPVVKFSYPPLRGISINGEGKASFFWPQYERARSQDLQELYHDAGQFYFIKTEELEKQKTLFTQRCKAIVLQELEVQDIDNQTDWQMAELKYRLLNNKMEEV